MQLQATDHLIDPFLSPATLAMALWPDGPSKWIPAKHLTLASAKIAHAIHKGDGRLIVSMPPRHGKSRLITETTIPWFLEKFPGLHAMLVSYNSDKAEEFGGKAKDIILSREDLFTVGVRRDRARVDRFETTTGSEVHFIGINGGATGKGAHLLIIDDFIKDIEEALSKSHREKTWMKFLANLDSRLEPGATIIIVATRWHSDDLIGRILSRLLGWEYICMPAIATEDNDILGRMKGDPLFPLRYPLKRLEELKRAQHGTVIFDALYQQKPIDDATEFTDGGWLTVVPNVPIGMTLSARAWDMAATQGGGDWTTGLKMAKHVTINKAYIENIVRKQLSPQKVEEEIRKTAVADGRNTVVLLEQEPGSAGKALVEHYKINVLPEFEVIAVPAGNKSKLIKAQPFIAAVEAGNVSMVYCEAWNDTFRDEFDVFGTSRSVNDDQIDTAAMCYNHLYQFELTSPSWGRSGLVAAQPGDIQAAVLEAKARQLVTGATWGR